MKGGRRPESSALKDPEARIALLHARSDALLLDDGEEALRLSMRALRVARSSRQSRLIALALHHTGKSHRPAGNIERSLDCQRKALALLENLPEEKVIEARVCRAIGELLNDRDYPQAYRFIRRALDRARESGDAEEVGWTLLYFGYHHLYGGEFDEALRRATSALEEWEHLDHRGGKAHAANLIAQIYTVLRDYRRALEWYFTGLELCAGDETRDARANILGNIGAQYSALGELDAALGYLFRAIDLYREIGSKLGEVICLYAVVLVHTRQKKFRLALDYQRRGLELVGDGQLESCHAQLLAAGANTYYEMGKLAKALEIYLEVVGLAKRIGFFDLEWGMYEEIARIYERLGDHLKALEYYKLYFEIRERLFGNDLRRSVARFEARMELRQMEESRRLSAARTEQLEEEMGGRSRELAALALQLVQKGEAITEVKRQILPLASSESHDVAGLARTLLGELDRSRHDEEGWRTFETQFRRLHHDFIQSIAARYPALTPVELKVCSLLKVGLSSKEIAGVLHTSVMTVNTHRRNIRRKLGLPEGGNLAAFMAAL